MVNQADFPSAYNGPYCNSKIEPKCQAPKCFVGSYPPVTPGGQMGPFFVNTYLLTPWRYAGTVSATPIREKDLSPCFFNYKN